MQYNLSKEEWKQRKVGLDEIFVALQEPTDPPPEGTVGELYNLIKCLETYQEELYTFFLNGFANFINLLKEESPQGTSTEATPTSEIRLIPSDKYPPEYVLRKLFRQTSYDLSAIERVIWQRKHPKLNRWLEFFDQLAKAAVYFAIENGEIIYPVKPFVYFQRDTSVRIIPYANALLINVPYSAIGQQIDILGIPHEVGHHIYQRGNFFREPINLYLSKRFAAQPAWIKNWLEEIFADMYGFLVAGPITALSIQDILLDNLPEGLLDDDGVHPVGTIRPFIYIKLLEIVASEANHKKDVLNEQRYSNLAKAMETRWNEKRKQAAIQRTFKPQGYTQEITEAEAVNLLDAIVNEMYQLFCRATGYTYDKYRKQHLWADFTVVGLDGEEDPENPRWERLGEAYDSLVVQPDELEQNEESGDSDSNATNISSVPSKLMEIADHSVKFDDYLQELGSPFSLSKAPKNEFWLKGQIDYWKGRGDLPALAPFIWELIFTAFGWAERGDDTRPVHGPE